MTAINVFATDETVEIYTDGAWLGSDGNVAEIGQKIFIFGHLPAVVAVRGGSHWLTILFERIGRRFADFDALTDGIVSAVRYLPPEYGALREAVAADRVELVLAGWSAARDKPLAFSLCNQPRDGIKAWEMRETERMISPTSETLMASMAGAGVDFQAFKPVSSHHAVALMTAQRAMAEEFNGAMIGFVGAFCHLTTVTRDGIATRVVKRWPDEIGKPITVQRATGKP